MKGKQRREETGWTSDFHFKGTQISSLHTVKTHLTAECLTASLSVACDRTLNHNSVFSETKR